MGQVTSIVLAGVGGQGTLLVSAILAQCLVIAGHDVKTSEVHGMAQRGGSVSTQVRYGKKVCSPIIGPGEADILVSFEIMEALRCLEFVRPGGKLIVNDRRIAPTQVLLGRKQYPEGIPDLLASKVDTTLINAQEIAVGIGNSRSANIVLLGALAEVVHLPDVSWEAAIASTVKPEHLEHNLRAYRAGRAAMAARLRESGG